MFPGDDEEGRRPTTNNIDQRDGSKGGNNSQYRSGIGEISDSTGGHSSLYQNKHIVGDEEEDIDSDGDIHSASDTPYYESSSTSSSTTISIPRQQQQQSEAASSSSSSFTSMEFDPSSSSSSGFLSVSSPQHELFGEFSKGEQDSDGSNRQESGSAKLKRILYGSPSSSSFSDDYDVIMSPSDSSSSTSDSGSSASEESKYYGKYDEDDIIRGRDQTNSLAEVDTGNENDIAPVNENRGKSKETINAIPPPKNEEHVGVPPSVSPRSLNMIDDAIVDHEESISSQDQIDSDGKIEENNFASSIAHSDVQSKQSKSHRENDTGKDAPSHNKDVMVVSPTSPNLSVDSDNRYSSELKTSTGNGIRSTDKGSTAKSSPIISNPSANLDESHRSSQNFKNSNIEVASRKTKIDLNRHYGDNDAHGTANLEISEQSQVVHFTDTNSSSNSGNEVERTKSTVWAGSETGKDNSKGFNGFESDEIGWKPPALITFSPSKFEKSPKEYQNDKLFKARGAIIRSKERKTNTPTGTKVMQRKRKTPKNKSPPPISQITVRPPPDDDSTLGTVGTYLERFPKERKNKKKKIGKPTANEIPPNSKISKRATNFVKDEASVDRNIRSIESDNTAFPVRFSQDEDSKISKRTTNFVRDEASLDRNIRSFERDDTAFPVRFSQDEDKFQVILEPKIPDVAKVHPQEPPDSTENKFSTDAISESKDLIENQVCSRADPPGDSFLFFYDHRDEQRPLLWSSDSTRPDTVDHFDKTLKSSESSSSIDHSNSISITTPRYLLPSLIPMTPWVPTIRKGTEREVDIDPTRAFINSLISEKRSIMSTQNRIKDLDLDLKSRLRLQEAKEAMGSEYSKSQYDVMRPTSISESMSKNISLPREMPRSEGSSSHSYEINVFGDSSSSMNGRGQISRTKASPSVSQSQSSAASSSSDSETPDSSQIVERLRGIPRRRASMSQLNDALEIQNGSKNSDNFSSSSSLSRASELAGRFVGPAKRGPRCRASMSRLNDALEIQYGSNNSDHSESSSSSSRALEFEELFPKQGGRRLSRIRDKKIIMRLLWLLAVLFIATAIVVAVFWQLGILYSPSDDDSTVPLPTPKPTLPSGSSADASSDVPSFAPTKIAGDKGIFSLIIEAYPQGRSALEDPNSPQSKALNWLESSANREISEAQRLLQRYALATLYYSTNGDDWINNIGWLSEENECNWMSRSKKAICGELGEYITLNLQENNLRGKLPAELGILSDTIRSLITRKNSLSGEIPSSIISDMKDLQVLDLSSNNYSGVLAQELFEATSLTRLSLFENSITSSIPTEIGQLTNLYVLDLGSNNLTSTIPPTISKLSKLAGLSLFNNMLTGTVPAEFSAIQSLEMLYIDSNNLEAPVPLEICELLDIDEFWGDCEKIQCIWCV